MFDNKLIDDVWSESLFKGWMGSRLYTINNKIEYVEASKSKPLDLESPMGLMKRCNDLCVRICANTILRVTAYVDIV